MLLMKKNNEGGNPTFLEDYLVVETYNAYLRCQIYCILHCYNIILFRLIRRILFSKNLLLESIYIVFNQ